jgi:hypothetical protein
MKRHATLAVCGLVLMLAVGPVLGTTIRPGFDSSDLYPNDDESTGQVPIGFTINFFGSTWSTLYANNNGNLTFTEPLWTYTPFPLTGQNTVIIAPFFADVDTRPTGSDVLRYGPGTVGSHLAWGATWNGVGYFNQHADLLNKFQVVLIDRSDIAAGDFDFEFNYEQILWDTGDVSNVSARAGYSNGVTGADERSYEIPGSAVPDSFFDVYVDTGLIYRSNIGVPGRFLFEVRSGQVQPVIPEPLTLTACLMGLGVLSLKLRRRLA